MDEKSTTMSSAKGTESDSFLGAEVEAAALESLRHICSECGELEAKAEGLQRGDVLCPSCGLLHKAQTEPAELQDLATLSYEELAPDRQPNEDDNGSKGVCLSSDANTEEEHPRVVADLQGKIADSVAKGDEMSSKKVCLSNDATSQGEGPRVVADLQGKMTEPVAELGRLVASLAEAEAQVDVDLLLLARHVQDLQAESRTALDEMQVVCDRVKAAIDARFQRVKDLLSKITRNRLKEAADVQTGLMNRRQEMEDLKKRAQSYQASACSSDVAELASLVIGRIAASLRSAPELPKTDMKLTLTVDWSLVERIEGVLSQLGTVAYHCPSSVASAGIGTLHRQEQEKVSTAPVNADPKNVTPTKHMQPSPLKPELKRILAQLSTTNLLESSNRLAAAGISTEADLQCLADLLAEKAWTQPENIPLCAQLAKLTLKMPKVPRLKKGPDDPDYVTFRGIFLSSCQRMFETRLVDEEGKPALGEDSQRRYRNNVLLVGELLKLKMLTENVIHDCISKLLKEKDPFTIDCVCALLKSAGKLLDTPKAKARMDQYFNKLSNLVSRFHLAPDILQLRKNNWVE